MRDLALHPEQDAFCVDRKLKIHVGFGEIGDVFHLAGNPGIVNQDIQPAVKPGEVFEHGVDLICFGYVSQASGRFRLIPQKLLKRLGLGLDDMDIIELNEAFAAQGLASLRRLGIDDDAEHVNPNGGAIALGHPLGMSGARLVTTAAYELQRRNGRYALCTMCIGVGQGIAIVMESLK